ncbi:MAG TPA: N-acetylneuraminate synthase family protein, partial [Halanaerobiales bacterium]|nr:N-acetylneuraminate synthase family protein [Halanaerobiales bacterium]
MIIVMKTNSSKQQVDHVIEHLKNADYGVHLSEGIQRTIIGAIGDQDDKEARMMKIRAIEGVQKVIPIMEPYRLTGKNFKPNRTVIDVNGVKIGGDEVVVMAGPCAVENEEQIIKTAQAVQKAGAKILRGGAFKPRTSPYSFQGLKEEGLKLLAKAREKTGLKVVTEVIDINKLDLVNQYTDIIQIGARNMQNYPLLKAAGKLDTPVMLKRSMSSTIKEWLLAAEYIMK